MHHKPLITSLAAIPLAVAGALGGAVALSSPANATGAGAFPGAEGFGTSTQGGRGGTTCLVTNLNDSGAGSFRACAEASGPRVVVFKTGGTINLNDRIVVDDPFLTVLGHTAPGDGITLRLAPTSTTDKGTILIDTHDVIFRYVRFRPGDNGHGDDSHDGVQIYDANGNNDLYNVVLDHTSVSWGIDENVNIYDNAHDITMSWSITSEALSNSTHPEGEHSKGWLAGGVNTHNVSLHHSLVTSSKDRNPQASGVSVADFRNNVIYNYGDGNGAGVTLLSSSKGNPELNWIGNYYKPGPDSPTSRPEFATYVGSNGETHGWYGEGNMRWTPAGDQPARVDAENAIGQRSTPFPAAEVTTTSAAMAYEQVLADAGASKVRDAVDMRIVDEVKTGTGSTKHTVQGLYPTLDPGTPPADADNDGLPDSWENSGLGATVDGDMDGDGYTNVEEWAESLISPSTETNQAPSVSAGADRKITAPMSARLNGSVRDDGRPTPATVTKKWRKLTGPGKVTFGTPKRAVTKASFSRAGTYVLRLRASDGAKSGKDKVTVKVNRRPVGDVS